MNNVYPLVIRLVKAKYYPHTDFLNAKVGAIPSFMWRSITAAQDAVQHGCRRHIGDGMNTRIWEVPWLPCPSKGFITSELP